MRIHYLQLATIPFNAIIAGEKTIESRLYDAKRQLIRIGDTIEFTNREMPERSVLVKVINLHRYKTFHDLFMNNDPAKFGGESVEWLVSQINEFYNASDQHAYGVVGIEFKRL